VYQITLLPDSVGGLMHLQYLDLSDTKIVSLLDSIYSLYNLETLLLVGCATLELLPTKTSNLINLWQPNITFSNVKKNA
jgi:Leucine-rich repeat (LRR) protein